MIARSMLLIGFERINLGIVERKGEKEHMRCKARKLKRVPNFVHKTLCLW